MSFCTALAALADAVAPRRCAGCGEEAPAGLCAGCVALLGAVALPTPQPAPHGRLLAAFGFGGIARRVLIAGKYRGRRGALHLLASVAAERLAPLLVATPARFVVPVPLGARRRRQRGYNQAAVLAAALALLPGTGPLCEGLRRRRETAGQVGRAAAARRTNLEGAFLWSGPPLPPGATVWLVDDVVTTGATLEAAAAALRAAGALRIERVAVARTP